MNNKKFFTRLYESIKNNLLRNYYIIIYITFSVKKYK